MSERLCTSNRRSLGSVPISSLDNFPSSSRSGFDHQPAFLIWSVVSGQWSVVSGQWSVVSGQWSVVSGQ